MDANRTAIQRSLFLKIVVIPKSDQSVFVENIPEKCQMIPMKNKKEAIPKNHP